MDNMAIWDAVSKTNPAHTKQVNQRGGFTAINANSQIMAATKQFGPVGIGWGYITGAPIFTPADQIIIPVTLWHGDRANTFGPEYGCAEYITAKGVRDSDAPKKATTDGLTKLLSRLGFNADVFLGLYDDQKYVEALEREFSPPAGPPPPVISEDQRIELMALFEASGVAPGHILKRASENAGHEVKDLRELPLSEYEPLKKFLTPKAAKEPAHA
jgi:hypothetical protein